MVNLKLHIEKSYTIDNQTFFTDIETAKFIVKNLIESIGELDLRALTDIHFPADYSEFVKTFSQLHGIKSEVTKTDTHEGFAITLEYFNDRKEVKSAVIYNPLTLVHLFGIAEGLEEYEGSLGKLVLSTFYHELFHVHDFATYQKMISAMNLDMGQYEYFYNVWTEYYVHRKISSLFPTYTIDEIHEEINLAFEGISRAIEFQEYAQLPRKISMVSRYIGELHAYERDLKEVETDLINIFSLCDIETTLRKMFEKYPEWNEEDLKASTKVVTEYYKSQILY